MNLHNGKKKAQFWLPKALEGEIGKVDVKLLTELWSLAPRAASTVRKLLKEIGNITIKPNDSAISVLAESITDPTIFNNWCNQDKYPRLIALAFSYLEKKAPSLSHHELKKIGFFIPFNGSKDTMVPNFEKVEELIKLVSDSKIERRYVSLAIWVMISNSQMARAKFPKEKRFEELQNVLYASLEKANLKEIIYYAEPNSWAPFKAKKFHEKIEDFTLENLAEETTEKEAISEISNWPFKEKENALILSIEEKIGQYNYTIKQLTAKIKLVSSENDPRATLKFIRESAESLESIYSDINKNFDASSQALNKHITEKLQSVGISFIDNRTPRLSIVSVTESVNFLKMKIQDNEKLFSIFEAFTNDSVKQEIRTENESKEVECNIESVWPLLERCETRYRCLDKGLISEAKLYSLILENLNNINWNSFKEQNITQEMWDDLGQYYISTRKNFVRLGIIMQFRFNSLSTIFGEMLVDEIGSKNKSKLIEIFDSLTWLSLGQQENLAKQYTELRIAIALAQIDAYLEGVEIGRECSIYWNSSPLSEIIHNYPNNLVKNFFRCFSDLVYAEKIDKQAFLNSISATQIEHVGRQSDGNFLNSFIDELKDILAFRRKGSKTTYATIWQAAYTEVIEPLFKVLNESGAQKFINSYTDWHDNFQIDNHIDNWKFEIPEHLKKNSAYDKFIRNQISIKISEINNWVKVYISLNESTELRRNDPLEGLKESIQQIFKSADVDSQLMGIWLKQKVVSQNSKGNRYTCQSHEQSPCNLPDDPFDRIDAAHPRAFFKCTSDLITFDLIYTDDLIASFGLHNTQTLLDIYADNELFEGYNIIASESNEEISPTLDRRVEKRIDEIDLDLRKRLSLLSSVNAKDEQFLNKLALAKSYLENQQWTLSRKCISEAETLSAEMSKVEEIRKRNENLVCQILRLGGVVEAKDFVETEKLKVILSNLLIRYDSRREHVKVLEKLKDLSGSSFEVELDSCLDKLDQLERLPSEAVSCQVGYYLEQAIDPLHKELSRSKTLLPSYVNQLKVLGKSLILNIQQDADLFSENSVLVSILVDTAELWQSFPNEGKPAVDQIIQIFIEKGIQPDKASLEDEQVDAPLVSNIPAEITNDALYKTEFEILQGPALLCASTTSGTTSSEQLSNLIGSRRWNEVSTICIERFKASNFKSDQELANWAISLALCNFQNFNQQELAAILRLINTKYDSPVINFLLKDKQSKGKIAELVSALLKGMASDLRSANENPTELETLQMLVQEIALTKSAQDNFRYCFEAGSFENFCLKAYWDSFTGEQKQAESRAFLMLLSWRMSAMQSLAYCLTLPPIDIEKRKAEALSKVANEALESGNNELLQGFLDLRKRLTGKPFHIFVDLIYNNAVPHESPANLTLIGGVERNHDGNLHGVLQIVPRRIDSPDQLSLRLPSNCPVVFGDGGFDNEFSGPFFTDTLLPIEFKLLDEYAVNFNVEVECTALSLTGNRSKFSQKLSFAINGDVPFQILSAEEIEDSFNGFPEAHMRGEEYVPRVLDEQKIEKALFKSKTVRSIWISSPRRSGKTTMLYRILDAYSHKVNRDNLVVYLTLDESFNTVYAFNRWIWRRLRSFAPNEELRQLYEEFESIGRDLPFDADAGTFLGILSDRLLKSRPQGTRIIYLIDEVDRFASMYFEGGEKKSASIDILWQIRHTITSRRDIGIVFAGSSAAKQLFIVNAESPFYNSIDHFELTPFSAKTPSMENASRQIVEPLKVRMNYILPKDSLEHLIWICAGIPYYMKLVAGASYRMTKQSHILKTDINEGLRALLAKETGISKLDDMGGDPGSDDLRTTIVKEKNNDSSLAKAVLYSLAEIYSPLNGHRPHRGRISSERSRLVYEYKLSKNDIERGIDICVGLGLIRMIENELVPELEFATPILGESIRKSLGRHWATIDHELASLAQERD